MERKQITGFVIVSLFAALIAAGAFIRIPFVPVAITLQTLFALLAAACLPPSMAISSVLIYLFLGAIGLPIFTTGGGIAAMLGPTGGYLIGMVPAAIAGSLIMKIMPRKGRPAAFISSLAATVCIYLVGLPWLAAEMDLSLHATLAAGLLPFLAGDTVKLIAASMAAPMIRQRIAEMLAAE